MRVLLKESGPDYMGQKMAAGEIVDVPDEVARFYLNGRGVLAPDPDPVVEEVVLPGPPDSEVETAEREAPPENAAKRTRKTPARKAVK